QYTLDIVFAISCVLMLIVVLWMMWADYDLDWKKQQRTFRDVETARNQRLMLEQLPDPAKIDELADQVKEMRAVRDKVREQVGPRQRELNAQREAADTRYRTIKADYDSRMSYFVIATEEYGKATGPDRDRIQKDLDERKKELDDINGKLT